MSYLYLCPYLFWAWKGKSKPWFAGATRESSNRTDGLVFLSFLVAWPLMLAVSGILRTIDETNPHRWVAALPMAALLGLHFVAIDSEKSRKLVKEFSQLDADRRRRITIISLSLYGTYFVASMVLARSIFASVAH